MIADEQCTCFEPVFSAGRILYSSENVVHRGLFVRGKRVRSFHVR